MLWSVVESSDGVSMRLLQSLLCPEKRKFHHDTILTVMNISIAILNYLIVNIILMLFNEQLLQRLTSDFLERATSATSNELILQRATSDITSIYKQQVNFKE